MSDEAILEQQHPAADARIAYGSDRQQFGDLRLPQLQNTLYPLVIMIHGGFWRAKYDLEHLGTFCEGLRERGLASWSIEYRRLGNGGGWPTTFTDVAQAVDMVRTLATQYPIDLDNIVLAGHSAGGHLALWAAARHRLNASSQVWVKQPLAIRAVVSLAGVSDLLAGWKQRVGSRVVEELLGGTPDTVPERYAQASPRALLPFGVPQVLIHGTHDGPVPWSLSKAYVEAAQAAGDDAKLISLPGARHFEMINPATKEWSIVADTIQALL